MINEVIKKAVANSSSISGQNQEVKRRSEFSFLLKKMTYKTTSTDKFFYLRRMPITTTPQKQQSISWVDVQLKRFFLSLPALKSAAHREINGYLVLPTSTTTTTPLFSSSSTHKDSQTIISYLFDYQNKKIYIMIITAHTKSIIDWLFI